jgi:uncharacterized protein
MRSDQPLPRRLAVLFAAVAIATGACFVDSGSDGTDGGPGGARPGASERARQPTTDEFEDDIRGAVGSAEEYWRGRFSDAGVRFAPIRQIGAYRQDGEVSCGGEPIPRNNAVYCSAGDFIAYDVNWAVTAYAKIGDAFVYYLLGHEYSHGIQVRLGIQYQYTIEQELQADCMAGAYIGDSSKSGGLTIEEGGHRRAAPGAAGRRRRPDHPVVHARRARHRPAAHRRVLRRLRALPDGVRADAVAAAPGGACAHPEGARGPDTASDGVVINVGHASTIGTPAIAAVC